MIKDSFSFRETGDFAVFSTLWSLVLCRLPASLVVQVLSCATRLAGMFISVVAVGVPFKSKPTCFRTLHHHCLRHESSLPCSSRRKFRPGADLRPSRRQHNLFFINNFFVCLVASIVLQTQCAKHHDLDKDCKPNVDGHRDAYRAATEAVSSEQTLLGIATGIAQLLTCKLWGDTGDSLALLPPPSSS